MTILSMGCTKACFDTQQGWHRDGGSEQSGASSSHTFLQKTLPRSKCSRIRAELAGGGEPLVGPAVHRTRQGDGPLLTAGTTGEPQRGTAGGQPQQSPHASPPGETTPNAHPQPLALAVRRVPSKSPRAGSAASMSLGGAAVLPVSRLLGSGPSACRRTAGKTQNNMYQERALGELISSHTWLWIAQHIPQDTAGEETPLPVTLRQRLAPALPSCAAGFAVAVSTGSAAGTGRRAARLRGADRQHQALLPAAIPGDKTEQNIAVLQVQRHHHHWDARRSAPSPAR